MANMNRVVFHETGRRLPSAIRIEFTMFHLLEKLINEHGSATILKEHLGLVQAQHTALERRCRDLEAENAALRLEIGEYQDQIKAVQTVAGKTVYCSHCGSSNLKRAGSRPDKVFGKLGVDRIDFICGDCGKTSDFLDD